MRQRSLAFSLIAAAAVLAGTIDFASAAQPAGRPLCRPALAFTDVQFSPMQPPTMERRWSATVLVDASSCAKNSAGYFEILFSRLKETAPEIDFHEEFMWFAFDWLPPVVRVEVPVSDQEIRHGAPIHAVRRRWRWRDSNPRARATIWGFSGRSRWEDLASRLPPAEHLSASSGSMSGRGPRAEPRP